MLKIKGEIIMGKKNKNNTWFICENCNYHASEEELREKLYVTDIKVSGLIAVECPRCGLEQIKN